MKSITNQLVSAAKCLLVLCFASFSVACQEQHRRPSLYLIPEDYVGWIRIDFGVDDAPPLTLEEDYYLFKIPQTGILQTSSSLEEGYAADEYFYYSPFGDSRRPLRGTISGGNGLIWGEVVSRVQDQKERHLYFFVGNEKQFKELGLKAKDREGNPTVGPITGEVPTDEPRR